jgi:hypothetical protein
MKLMNSRPILLLAQEQESRGPRSRDIEDWEVAGAPGKRRLQTLIFPEGVTFDGNGLGTPVIAFISVF